MGTGGNYERSADNGKEDNAELRRGVIQQIARQKPGEPGGERRQTRRNLRGGGPIPYREAERRRAAGNNGRNRPAAMRRRAVEGRM